MALTIKWRNRNPVDGFQGFELYRSTTKADVFTAANKIATLLPTVTEYVDSDMNPGSSFYYGVRTLSLDGYYIDGSANLIGWPTEYGYGRTTLMSGSAEMGIYDILPATDFPIAAALTSILDRAGFNLLSNTMVTLVFNDVTNKISYGGKVMFVPSGYLISFANSVDVTAARNQYKAILAACNANQFYYDFQGERYYFKLATDLQMVQDVMAPIINEMAGNYGRQISLFPSSISSANYGSHFLFGYDATDKSLTFGSTSVSSSPPVMATGLWTTTQSANRMFLPFYAVPGGPI